MATTDILGLFMSPEQYQAQQMAQQQAGEQQRAFNFAGLDPRQQANYGVFLGAQQLGRGFGGLLGVQDPQLQRIRQRQEIMQSINPADPQSLMAGIQRAAQTNDQELALTLTDFMNKQGSEMALAQQRKAQAARERTQALPAGVQEAELIGKLTEDLQKTTDPNQRAIIQAKIQRLQKTLRPGAEDKVEELEQLLDARDAAVAQFGVDSNAVRSIDRRISVVAPLKGGAGGEGDGDGAGKSKNKEIAIARERAKLTAKLRSLDAQNMTGSPEYLEAQDELNFLNQAVVAKPTDVEFKLNQARPLIARRNELLFQGYSTESKEIKDIDDELDILGAKRGEGKKSQPTSTEQLETLYTRLSEAETNAANINPDPAAIAKDPEVALVRKLISQTERAAPAEPERVRIAAEIRKRKNELKDLKPDSDTFKAVEEDIAFLENRRDGKQPNVSAAVDEIALTEFNKSFIDLTPAQRTQVLNKQKEEAKKEKNIAYGVDREAISEEFFEKPFSELTKEQKVKVNAVKEEREGTVAQKGAAKLVLPGQEKPVDVLSFRISARKAVEPYIDTIDNGDNALAALKNARTPDGKTNESSFNQGVAYLASMAQSGRLSNKDVELVKESPAVLRSLQNYVSTKWEGVPTQPTINGIIDTVRIIRKVAKAKYDREIAAQRKLADLSGMSPTQRDTLFEDMTPGSGRGGDGGGGGGGGGAKPKTVPFNSLPK